MSSRNARQQNVHHSLYGFHAGPVVGEQLEQFIPLLDGDLRPGGHSENFRRRLRHPPGFPGVPDRLLVQRLGLAQQFAEQRFCNAKILHVRGESGDSGNG